MLNFLKKKNKNKIDMDNSSLIKITALLIHAAKIDENYTEKEKKIIRKAIFELDSKDNNIDEVLIKAEEIEKNSNQILDFTKEVKNMNEDSKIKIIEVLWKIVLSDGKVHEFESNLIRRLAGLLYISDVSCGNAKNRAINSS